MQIVGPALVAFTLLMGLARLAVHGRASSRAWAVMVAGISVVVVVLWQPWAAALTACLVAVTIVADRLARSVRPQRSRPVLWAATCAILAPLLIFKYVPWVVGKSPVSLWGVTVPLGLSFTVFRLVGVLWDHANLRMSSEPSRVVLLGFLYPTFSAGPICGVTSLRESDDRDAFLFGCRRMLIGLARKFLLADGLYALTVAGLLRADISQLDYGQCLVLPVALGFYLYWDFAGYSDLAIGMAALLGYRVPENFARPYMSENVVEFWRRWHITLSEWIRLRVMMKLVGRRPTRLQLHSATLASMALCGLWHGAGLNYVAWGLWHGLGLSAVHLFREAQRGRVWAQRLAAGLGVRGSRAVTFLFVTTGWVLFFLPVDRAWQLLGRIATLDGASAQRLTPAIALALVLAIGAELGRPAVELVQRLPRLVRGSAWTLLLAAVTYVLCFMGSGGQEFVYASF